MHRISDFVLSYKRWLAVAHASRSRSPLSWVTVTAHALLRGRIPGTPGCTHDVRGHHGLGPDEPLSQLSPDMAKPPPLSPERLGDSFCYTA